MRIAMSGRQTGGRRRVRTDGGAELATSEYFRRMGRCLTPHSRPSA
ncbi:hypothetical protein [Nocardiopsis sp. NRRL B-16309]|nr:hypothetical protein [Nocardiopsis sp. NRRL B-16309]